MTAPAVTDDAAAAAADANDNNDDAADAAPPMPWRERLELSVGKGQLHALRRVMARVAGLRPGVADVGGHRLAYLDRGAGDPLVCVHGFGGDKETWLLMAPWLPRRWRTVLLDLPGHGASSAIGEADASARAQAATLARFLDARGIDRAIVAGNSMGGGIALRFAHDFPDRVRALVLVASVGPVVIDNELTRALARGDNLLVPSSRQQTDDFLRTVTARPPRVPRAIQRYVTAQRVAAQDRLQIIFRGWAQHRAGDGVPTDLAGLDVPALVLHGALDRIIHPATADDLAARLPRARRVILDGIGHVPQLEAPSDVARRIAEFAAGL
ncbi:MAG: alpha/beta fold hydrolase [Kofleriaceae bacterium]|nr:alpha/beta fold hydrolase [Myxococcales bacterium]MCB9571983.1 alpha/beta fold hydrolase [Kofleriaceae bacterium]